MTVALIIFAFGLLYVIDQGIATYKSERRLYF